MLCRLCYFSRKRNLSSASLSQILAVSWTIHASLNSVVSELSPSSISSCVEACFVSLIYFIFDDWTVKVKLKVQEGQIAWICRVIWRRIHLIFALAFSMHSGTQFQECHMHRYLSKAKQCREREREREIKRVALSPNLCGGGVASCHAIAVIVSNFLSFRWKWTTAAELARV